MTTIVPHSLPPPPSLHLRGFPSASSTYSPSSQHSASTNRPFPLSCQRLQRHRSRPPLSHPTTDPATPPCVPHLSNDLLLMLYQLTLQTAFVSLSLSLSLSFSTSFPHSSSFYFCLSLTSAGYLLPSPLCLLPFLSILLSFNPALPFSFSLSLSPALSLVPVSSANQPAGYARSLAKQVERVHEQEWRGGGLFRRRNWCSDFSGVRFFYHPRSFRGFCSSIIPLRNVLLFRTLRRCSSVSGNGGWAQ